MDEVQGWSEWPCAWEWAEALALWHYDQYPSVWPADPGEARRELAQLTCLLGYAVQAAARLGGVRARHPDDLGPVPMVRAHTFLYPTLACNLLDTDTLGPSVDEPGREDLHTLRRASEQPDQWLYLVTRAAGVLARHFAPLPSTGGQSRTLADRTQALEAMQHRRTFAQLEHLLDDPH